MQKVLVIGVLETVLLSGRHIVVDDQIDLRYIDTTSQNIRRDQRREESLAEPINDLVAFLILNATNQHLGLDASCLQSVFECHSGVFPVYKEHGHCAIKLRVQHNDKIKLPLLISHRHLKVLDTFELLGLFLDGEVLELSNKTSNEVYGRIGKCRGI